MNNNNENTDVLYLVPGETEPTAVPAGAVENFLADYPEATPVNPEDEKTIKKSGSNSIVDNIPELIRNPDNGVVTTQRPLDKAAGEAENLEGFVQSTIAEKVDQNEFLEDGITPNPNFGKQKLHLQESESEEFVDQYAGYEMSSSEKDIITNDLNTQFDLDRQRSLVVEQEKFRNENIDAITRDMYTQTSGADGFPAKGTPTYEYRVDGEIHPSMHGKSFLTKAEMLEHQRQRKQFKDGVIPEGYNWNYVGNTGWFYKQGTDGYSSSNHPSARYLKKGSNGKFKGEFEFMDKSMSEPEIISEHADKLNYENHTRNEATNKYLEKHSISQLDLLNMSDEDKEKFNVKMYASQDWKAFKSEADDFIASIPHDVYKQTDEQKAQLEKVKESIVSNAIGQAEYEYLTKQIDENMPKNWHNDLLTFWRSKSQKKLNEKAEFHLATLKDEQKQGLGRLIEMEDVYDNSIDRLNSIVGFKNEDGEFTPGVLNRYDAEIKEILKQEYTTQEGVDAANAKLEAYRPKIKALLEERELLIKRAKDYGMAMSVTHDEIVEAGLNEGQLSAYAQATDRNYSQILNVGNSLVGAAVDLGIGIVSSIDQLYDLIDNTVELLPEGVVKDAAEIFTKVTPFMAAAAPLFDDESHFSSESIIPGERQDLWGQIVDNQATWREENINSKLRKPVAYGEIDGFSDALEWSANMVAAQIPNLTLMAATGGYGLALLGMSSSGTKYNQLQDERELYYKTGGMYGMEHDFWSMQANAMITGTAEALSERVTLGTIRKTKGILAGMSKKGLKDMSRTAYANYLRKQVFTPRNIAASGYEMFKEGGTEVLATLGGNLADIYISGKKDVNIYDNLAESFVSGVLINGVIQSPRLYATMKAPFQSKNTTSLVSKNVDKIQELQDKIKEIDGMDLSNADKKVKIEGINKQIVGLQDANMIMIEQDVKRVDVLHNSEKKALIEIQKRNDADNKEIDNIKTDTDLTVEQRAEKIEALEKKIKTRDGRKQQILDKYPPNVVNENYAAKVETLKKMAKMSEKMGGPKINVQELSNDNFINKTSKYDYNQSKSQIKKIANQNQGLITSLNNIIKDPNSTPQEVQDAQTKLDSATQQLDLANNILNSGDYGVMQPRYDTDGNIGSLDVLINKDTALKDGMLNTAAHEFIHAAFANTLKADPNMRKILGGQLKTILEGKGVTFSSQAKIDEFNARIASYKNKDGSPALDIQGEEMMAIASEMMLDGDISFNDGVLQKLKNVFRRFTQNTIGYDIAFNKTEDIKNFMRDYHHSIENNKPSPAIAKMLAKGANGKIFKDARTPSERKSEAMYNRNLESITKKNPDWKRNFDQYTQNPDGTKRYDSKEDFQASDDFWPAFQEIGKSQALKNLIMAGTASETGINSSAEMDDFVRKVIENIEDRYSGGLTKKAIAEIKKIEDKRAKNELTPKETVEAIEKIENDPKSRRKGFDASAANGSLFGWLTSIAVFNAKRDVRKQFIKEQGGRGRKVSTEQQVGEGRTLKDLLPGVTDVAMERFESERILEKAKVDPQNLKVEDILNFAVGVKDEMYSSIVEANIDIGNLTYKDVKKLLNVSDKAELRKLKQKVSSLTVTPKGALFNILDIVANKFGDGIALRILAGQDLNTKQRQSAQTKIIQMSINADGSFNPQLLNMLPEGLDRDGRATGVANTSLKPFYLVGDRVKVKKGALKELGQNYAKNKRTDVTLAEFLNVFGINENGTKRPGTKADGAIRELILQIGQLQANQALRTHAIKTESHPANVIYKLGDGRSESMYSTKTPLLGDMPRSRLAATIEVINNYGNSNYDSLIDNLINQVKIKNPNIKTENLESLINTIEQLAFEEYLKKPGTGYNSTIYNSNNIPESLKKLFEVRGKTNQVIYTGPKLYNKQDNGYGLVNDAQIQYMNEVGEVLKSTHPDVSMKDLFPAFGIKDSGSKQFNGKTTYSTRSINPKAHNSKIKEINRVEREVNRKTEEKLMEGNGMTRSDINSLKFAQPMAFKGRVAQLIKKLWAEPSLIKKLQMLGQFLPEISNINNGNKAMMKYIAIKQMQARGTVMSDVNLYHLGAMQTNIIEGTRAWSTFKHIQLIEGQQWFGNKPTKNIKNYDSKLKEHYKNWRKHPLFKQALDIAKNYRSKSKPNGLKGQELLDKAINYLTPYNEHLAASSSTHGMRLSYIFSGGKDVSLDNLVGHHESFFGHKFIPTELLDKRGEKISLEGDMRITKSATEYHRTIYHNTGKQVSEYIIENERLVELAKEIEKNKAPVNITNGIGVIQQIQNNSLRSQKVPKVRGMSTFDFDDTLASTKSGVRVNIPNTDGKPKPKRKVIFLAGGAGSGKSNVVNKLGLEGAGMKIVNQDISLEWLKKNAGLPADMRDLTKEQRSTLGKLSHQARGIAKRKMMKYQGNGEGVVVDGTGASAKNMQKLVEEFKAKGYDVGMIFVETSVETSLKRNRARKERSLLDIIVKKNHESVMNNKSEFMQLFGDRFMEVNTDNMDMDSPMPKKLVNGVKNYINSYERVRLDAEQFAEQGDDIASRGGEFDFSEFNQVIDGKEGPLLKKAIDRAKKYGTKDLFILTARPQASAKAIQIFLKSQGLNVPLKNITGLANSTGNAKAQWMLDKFAEGYNDMYFVDDAMKNVDAVKHVLDQLDIKSEVVQAKLKGINKIVKTDTDAMKSKVVQEVDQDGKEVGDIDVQFNDMIERATGIESNKVYSKAEGIVEGRVKGRFDFFIPPSAEDFKGLMYKLLGRGNVGNADLKFIKDKLLKPFAKGMRDWNTFKQRMVNEYKALKKKLPNVAKNLKQLVPNTNFTNDAAVRVYLWNKNGTEVPGLSNAMKRTLSDHVANNPELKAYADALGEISRMPNGYVAPTDYWMVETIGSDLNNAVSKDGRKRFLSEWLANKEIIFSPQNLAKLEAAYGSDYVSALKDMLYRMETGVNRPSGKSKTVNMLMNWINGSVGAVMFFNIRSAALQTISTVNFINWGDNNIFKAAAAFANIPQFSKDFAYIFNSDMLKQRRGGMQMDLNVNELTNVFQESGNSPHKLISWLLEKGFAPTRIADSFAIAFGGASMYRNRIKKYMKEGMTEVDAKEKAWLDFQEIAEETQQSSRPDLISQQQAGPLGRLILAWQNTPMQMTRLMKKALSDLVNGRGDTKTNISKIMYYGAIQNIIFGSLQNGLAWLMYGDEEDQEEEIKSKTKRALNSSLDTLLRGTGMYGAAVAALKNTIIKWDEQRHKGYGKKRWEKVILELISFSPPIGSKLRKIMHAINADDFDKGVSEQIPWRVENPKLAIWANIIEAATNIPLARLVNKANNLEEAIYGDHEMWKRIALVSGWSRWDIGIEDSTIESAKIDAKDKREEDKKKEKVIQKQKEKLEKEKQGIKTIRCSGIRSNGERCSITTETKAKTWKCMHHSEFEDGMDRDNDGKPEYQCTATKNNGERCKNKTENTNKKCYAHQ